MSDEHPSGSGRRLRQLAVPAVTAVLLVQLLAVFCFTYVRTSAAPAGLPLAVAGPPQVTDLLRQGLTAAAPGVFDVRTVGGPDAARAAIQDREVYGAVVVEAPAGAPATPPAGAGPTATLMVSTAAGAQLAGQLGDALTPALTARGVAVEVRDVVPADPDDPTGSAVTSMVLPMVLTAMAAAAVLTVVAPGRRGLHVVLLVAFAATAGTATAFLLVDGLGALPGSTWSLAGVLSLGVLAIALTAYAGERLLGGAGLGLVVLTMLLVGLQAATIPAPELLPDVWRQVGPWLPPSAMADAARGVAYFDGAALATPLAILTTYAALGALTLLPWRRRTRPPATQPSPAQSSTVPVS